MFSAAKHLAVKHCRIIVMLSAAKYLAAEHRDSKEILRFACR